MKHTISSLAKFAENIGRKKFLALSSKKKHELLAAMALEALHKKKYDFFIKRYEIFHKWADLDRFYPPSWLNNEEKLKGYYDFHISFSSNPPLIEKEKPPDQSFRKTFDLVIYLDEIRSPYNIGSILRIADNFGIKEVVHSSRYIDPNNSRLKKASMGTYRWIPLKYIENPVPWLKNSDKNVVGLETTKHAVNIKNFNFNESLILVAGNEENGISSKILSCCDQIIKIPMFGFKNSMNVNNALSIVCQRYCENLKKFQ
ncbi:MAG: hypothetical protein CSA18_04000 [Deltaproteobacteria bacterium]|nr:MAG: hypothetical protein CSA18_04000 [Deltaproteobacteria bacterium]